MKSLLTLSLGILILGSVAGANPLSSAAKADFSRLNKTNLGNSKITDIKWTASKNGFDKSRQFSSGNDKGNGGDAVAVDDQLIMRDFLAAGSFETVEDNRRFLEQIPNFKALIQNISRQDASLALQLSSFALSIPIYISSEILPVDSSGQAPLVAYEAEDSWIALMISSDFLKDRNAAQVLVQAILNGKNRDLFYRKLNLAEQVFDTSVNPYLRCAALRTTGASEPGLDLFLGMNCAAANKYPYLAFELFIAEKFKIQGWKYEYAQTTKDPIMDFSIQITPRKLVGLKTYDQLGGTIANVHVNGSLSPEQLNTQKYYCELNKKTFKNVQQQLNESRSVAEMSKALLEFLNSPRNNAGDKAVLAFYLSVPDWGDAKTTLGKTLSNALEAMKLDMVPYNDFIRNNEICVQKFGSQI